jgi:hypothetical protein
MKSSTFLILTIIAVFLFSCTDSFDESLLHGDWKTTDWYILDTNQKINNQMDFSFDADRRYTIDYGTEKEMGKYWIAVDYLHTVEDGKAEKKVRIVNLNADTLLMEMNRGGQLERLVLTK